MNYQCIDDSKNYCDYCAVGLYCCSYETNLVRDLTAWCKLNTTYSELTKLELAKNQPMYRCQNKTSGKDYTTGALFLQTSSLTTFAALLLGFLLFLY